MTAGFTELFAEIEISYCYFLVKTPQKNNLLQNTVTGYLLTIQTNYFIKVHFVIAEKFAELSLMKYSPDAKPEASQVIEYSPAFTL